MKIAFIVLCCLVGAFEAGAANRTLSCSPGAPLREFTAVLDDSAFDPGSGFFDVKNARIRFEYASARLICAGHTLEEISCVGFWFDQGDKIVNVTIGQNVSGVFATTKNLTPGPVADGVSWKCTVR